MNQMRRIAFHFEVASQTLLQCNVKQFPHGWCMRRYQKQAQNRPRTQNLSSPKQSDTALLSKPMFSSLASQDQSPAYPLLANPLRVFTRQKSRRQQPDSDDDSDSDVDNDKLDEDDFEAPPKFKVLTIHAPSLRTDAVVSNSLNVSRNRLEELFLASRLLFNGATMPKKGMKMDEGDFVDVISEKLEDQIRVKRVKLLKINPDKTGTGKFILKVRVWKTPFLLDFTRSRDRP